MNTFRKLSIPFLILMLAGCVGQLPKETGTNPDQPPNLRYYAFEAYAKAFRGPAKQNEPPIVEQFKERGPVQPGQSMGTAEEPLEVLSQKHGDRIQKSRALYDDQDYLEAIEEIKPAYKDEPDNPFILETYARALFRAPGMRPQSLSMYLRLMKILDAQGNDRKGTIVISAPFIDAYWKMGLLHLDSGEYGPAALEISKALAGGMWKTPGAQEQALGYLTEAFFHLNNYEAAGYYGSLTLLLNPKNTYVLQYLKQIPEPK